MSACVPKQGPVGCARQLGGRAASHAGVRVCLSVMLCTLPLAPHNNARECRPSRARAPSRGACPKARRGRAGRQRAGAHGRARRAERLWRHRDAGAPRGCRGCAARLRAGQVLCREQGLGWGAVSRTLVCYTSVHLPAPGVIVARAQAERVRALRRAAAKAEPGLWDLVKPSAERGGHCIAGFMGSGEVPTGKRRHVRPAQSASARRSARRPRPPRSWRPRPRPRTWSAAAAPAPARPTARRTATGPTAPACPATHRSGGRPSQPKRPHSPFR